MKMNSSVQHNSRIKPIQVKGNKANITLYIEVKLYHNGLNIETVRVSSGITIEKTRWNNGKVKGRDIEANNLNEKLTAYLTKTNELLAEISHKKIASLKEVKSEIENNLSERLFGRVKRGGKEEKISKLKTYTYEYVLEHKLRNEPVSKERERQYHLNHKLIKEYFKGEIPPINLFTKKEVEGVKKWLTEKYSNKNTLTTRLSYFSAVLQYAYKVLEIISIDPIPKKYYGGYERGKRDILSKDEMAKILSLKDFELSEPEKKAKYTLGLAFLTGIGYGDLQSMKYENIKENEHGKYIEKNRNKTDIPFKIYLSENAYFMLKEMVRLTGNDNKPFNLPTLDFSNRTYKKLAKKAGIAKNITSYVARHTFAIDYMENGGRIEDLQVILGHSSILITSKVYGRISDKRLAETMKLQQAASPIHRINRLVAV